MPFTNLDRVALKIGTRTFAELSADDQQTIDRSVRAVEQVLSNPPWNFRVTNALFTEYLPQSGRQVEEFDLTDYDVNQEGLVVPIDQEIGRSTLQLKYTPVLEADLEIYEDRAAYGGQGDTAFGDESQLTKGVDYFLDCDQPGLSTSGIVHRITGAWSREPRSIMVTYRGGPQAQAVSEIGVGFVEVYQECVANCVVHYYSFLSRQKKSFAAGDAGYVVTGERIGKYSNSKGPPVGSTSGASGSFTFGGLPTIAPEELLSPLSSFVNLGALLAR